LSEYVDTWLVKLIQETKNGHTAFADGIHDQLSFEHVTCDKRAYRFLSRLQALRATAQAWEVLGYDMERAGLAYRAFCCISADVQLGPVECDKGIPCICCHHFPNG